jgi:hypothetical protein
MRGFWVPIGIRAAAVFFIGMLVWAGVRHFKQHHVHFGGIDEHEQAAEAQVLAQQAAIDAQVSGALAAANAAKALSSAPSALLAQKLSKLGTVSGPAGIPGLKDLPPAFVLDGRKAGSILRFQGSRAERDTRAEFSVVVRLAPDARGAPCDIVPVPADDFDLEKGFRCAVKGEPGLAKFGTVRFEPGGTRSVLAAESKAAELTKGDPFAIDADLSGPMRLMVKGDDGELVKLQSDSLGTALVVNDEDGRAVMRMQAGKSGFSITVDTTKR